ncbi:hypothetical protein PG911_01715 [Tenacibaculum ovolyticum]|uniref:MbnP family protein n=1 Tax=Tenacibaculum ovolyticum TaxID=104270 RepID=UPI00041E0372|nr:MbnP family protein [Tenacibaculum ovolyticum]WBX77002.1 hypothetical protein PG911_01715 [Tenacibaculum ovolyticum]
MKQYLILFLSLALFSCSSDNDELIKEVSVKIKFSQNWDGTTIEKSDLANTKFTNKLGTKLSIEKLRYLVSKMTLTNGSNEATVFDDYKLVDLSDSESLIHSSTLKISEGTYNLSMTFGFNNDDNYKAEGYQDLNSASWNVPDMLGGGYHYMQMEGKFLNKDIEEQGFAYHAIRAVDKTDPVNLKFDDTFFTVDLGVISIKNNATVEIKMNAAEWFRNPNDWDLNELNSMLMPNFEAQKLMSANGKNGVFSLGTITQ